MAHLPLLFQGKGRLISAAALKVLEDLRALDVHQIVIERYFSPSFTALPEETVTALQWA